MPAPWPVQLLRSSYLFVDGSWPGLSLINARLQRYNTMSGSSPPAVGHCWQRQVWSPPPGLSPSYGLAPHSLARSACEASTIASTAALIASACTARVKQFGLSLGSAHDT